MWGVSTAFYAAEVEFKFALVAYETVQW